MAKKRSSWWWSLGIFAAALVVALGFASADFQAPEQSFGQCLSDVGVTMYGSDQCQHCRDQKMLFEDDFEHVDYVNCDFQEALCREKGITFYPVWTKGNDILVGVQSLNQLSTFSGCELPSQTFSSP